MWEVRIRTFDHRFNLWRREFTPDRAMQWVCVAVFDSFGQAMKRMRELKGTTK